MRITGTHEAREKQELIHIVRKQDASDQLVLSGGTGMTSSLGVVAAAENGQASGVTLELSENGKAMQNDKQKLQDDAQWIQKWAQELYEQQAEASKKGAKAFDDVAKAMEIARRIARGDIVPLKDEKKLIEFSADLYQVAKASAAINAEKKHKKYDSLYDDEEDPMRDKMRALDRENEMKDAAAFSASMAAPPQMDTAAGIKKIYAGQDSAS